MPGLSLRGRPRKQNSLKATERAAASRQKRLAAGTKRVELMLEPAVALQLDALAEHFKESRTELVSRLLRKAASRHLR